MINSNLAAEPLIHCIKISGAKVLIADIDGPSQERIRGSEEKLRNDLGINIIPLTDQLKTEITSFPTNRPADALRAESSGKMPLALIYTSGTTGLPKAFPFNIDKTYATAVLAPYMLGTQKGDRWYVSMPFYHGTGGVSALVQLSAGTAVAIGRKFSLRQFWKDVRDSEATAFVYVGETARYLLSAPPSADDKNHKVRLAYGNGMRPDVWPKFQERFGRRYCYVTGRLLT